MLFAGGRWRGSMYLAGVIARWNAGSKYKFMPAVELLYARGVRGKIVRARDREQSVHP